MDTTIVDAIITDMSNRVFGASSRNGAIYVIRFEKQEPIRAIASVLYRGDFLWYQTNETDTPSAFLEYQGNDVLFFGDMNDDIYTISNDTVQIAYIDKTEPPDEYVNYHNNSDVYIITNTVSFERLSECSVFLSHNC